MHKTVGDRRQVLRGVANDVSFCRAPTHEAADGTSHATIWITRPR